MHGWFDSHTSFTVAKDMCLNHFRPLCPVPSISHDLGDFHSLERLPFDCLDAIEPMGSVSGHWARVASGKLIVPKHPATNRSAHRKMFGLNSTFVFLFAIELEDYVNRGIHFNRLTINQCRLIDPLPHCVQGCLLQQGMP